MKPPPISESALQIQCIRWFDTQYPYWSKFLFHIRNGGSIKSAREGAKFKRMGVRKGIPDLFLSIPAGGTHGFYIELKKQNGKPSEEQIENGNSFQELGYRFEIISDLETFMASVNSHMLNILK